MKLKFQKNYVNLCLEEAEETILGQKNGAKKQYRYGNLHIREYNDKFLVHTDKIDPRVNPLGHLIHDAPEVFNWYCMWNICRCKYCKKVF